MGTTNQEPTLAPEPKMATHHGSGAKVRIGLLGNYPDSEETRLLLTPEACGMLTSAGIEVLMEEGAGVDISFTDEKYAEYGVGIRSREEVLRQPVVLSFQPIKPDDIKKMTPGSALLCMMGPTLFESTTIKALLDRQIDAGCFDNMYSHHDITIFADIIDQIDGRGAIMYAQEALSYLGGGKGVLLGAIAGLNPCEVLVLGSGTEAIAAANAAALAGARSVVMDNDVSALELARQSVYNSVELVAIHPRVLTNRVKSADVIIVASTTYEFKFPKSLSSSLKDNVYVLDLNDVHPSVSVPRTVAMALSNPLINFFNEMSIKGGFDGMISTTPGMQVGIVTYKGKLVDKLIGSCVGLPSVDIRVMLSATN